MAGLLSRLLAYAFRCLSAKRLMLPRQCASNEWVFTMNRTMTFLLTILVGLSAVADDDAESLKPTNVPWPPVPEEQVKRYTA